VGQAEQYYKQALAIKIEFNDRYEQARTYHNLGAVAQKQWQWEQARDYFLKDLAITAEFDDKHGLEITLRKPWPSVAGQS
jgi:Tfp pilus assembly protein PilF